MDEAKYKLKKLIKELEKIKGRHTELVTIYVPAGHNINTIANQVAAEISTAQNIKSKTVRKNVTDALEKILQELKGIKKTPKNGLAIFCGNISEIEGKQDLRIWMIEPPEPINIKLYRCDQQFILDPLKDLLEPKNVYGLIVLDVKEANIALLKGKSIIPIKHMESFVRGKMKAGGQSAVRFAREREEEKKQFFIKVADRIVDAFKGVKLTGILVGGPGPTKDEFVNGPFLPEELKKKIIAIQDIGYTGEQGLKELVNKSSDVLAQEEIILEKKLLNEFMLHLARDDGLAIYGKDEVWQKLNEGTVDRLLLSEDLPEEEIEHFSEAAKMFSTKVELISTETPEGAQFKELGGYGAILRYKI